MGYGYSQDHTFRNIIIGLCVLCCVPICNRSTCGYSSVDNNLIGQIKKVHHNTPLVCPNYDSVDVSLGVLRNGAGSMSTQDMELVVDDDSLLPELEKFAQTGQIVTITYNDYRMSWCVPTPALTKVEAAPAK